MILLRVLCALCGDLQFRGFTQAVVIPTLGKLAAEDARTLRALLDAILE